MVSQQLLNEKQMVQNQVFSIMPTVTEYLQEFFFMIHHKQINIRTSCIFYFFVLSMYIIETQMKIIILIWNSTFLLNPVNGVSSRLKQLLSSHRWIIVYGTASSGNRNISSIFFIDKWLIQLLFISQVKKRNDEHSMTIEVYDCFPLLPNQSTHTSNQLLFSFLRRYRLYHSYLLDNELKA